MMFLDKYEDKKKKEIFVEKVKEKINNIQEERKNIGKIIEQKMEEGIPKKELLEMLLLTTSLTKNAINNLIEEYIFNTKYNTKYNISEIKHLKFYFKKNEITEKDKIKILKDEKHINEIFKNTGKKANNAKIKHTFLLDEDTETLYETSKEIMEKIIDRKLKTKSEFFYYLLLEFVNNNIELIEGREI